MPDNDNQQDIIDWLLTVAANVKDTPPGEIVSVLVHAADAIETLRTMVGIREEIQLEDGEP